MSVTRLPAIGLRRFSPKTRLLLSVGLFLCFGAGFASLLPEAFVGPTPLKRTLANVFPRVPFVNLVTVSMVPLGVYLATVVLLFVDQLKRIQSLLFLVATAVAVSGALAAGLLVQQGGPLDILVLTVSFLISLNRLGGEQLSRVRLSNDEKLFETERNELITFPAAERVLFYIVAAFSLLTLFEAHTTYGALVVTKSGGVAPNLGFLDNFAVVGSEAKIVVDLVIGLGLVATTKNLLGYEAERDVVMIGPKRSGKTHTAVAMNIESRDNGSHVKDFGDMTEYRQNFLGNGAADGGFIDPNEVGDEDDYTHVGFKYVDGQYFRKNVTVHGFDFPGELAPSIGVGLELFDETELAATGDTESILENSWMDVPVDTTDPKFRRFASEVKERSTASESRESSVTDGGQPDADETRDYSDIDSSESSSDDSAVDLDTGQQTEDESGDDAGEETESPAYDGESFESRTKLLLQYVLPVVARADTIVFLFDAYQIRSPDEDFDVSYYEQITQQQTKHSKSMSVITKADVLADDFKQQHGHPPGEALDQFMEHARAEIQAAGVGNEMRSVGNDPVAVYIKSQKVEDERGGDDTFVPVFAEGKPITRGFERLLDRLGGL
jgi:hypothetical protein